MALLQPEPVRRRVQLPAVRPPTPVSYDDYCWVEPERTPPVILPSAPAETPAPGDSTPIRAVLEDGSVVVTTVGAFQGNLSATVFGAPSSRQAAPRFFFPGVTNGGKGEHAFAIVPVVPGGFPDASVKNAIPEAGLGSPSGQILGSSGGLAILLANLDAAGFPVRPGTYSGEVQNVRVFRAGNNPRGRIVEVAFELLPVDAQSAKIKDSRIASEILLGLFENGWYNGHTFAQTLQSDQIFPPSRVEVKSVPVPVPEGYRGTAFQVSAWTL